MATGILDSRNVAPVISFAVINMAVEQTQSVNTIVQVCQRNYSNNK